MSRSSKRGSRRADLKAPSQHVLDIVDVLFSVAENGDKAVSNAILGSPAFQRLYRQCTSLEADWMQTPHSDLSNEVAQADRTGLDPEDD